MANERHVQLILQGAEEWNRWRSAHPRVQPDLRHAALNDADLAGANLADALLTGAELVLASLNGAALARADLCMANLSGADLRNVDFTGANLDGARLLGADLAEANLCGADLGGAEGLSQEGISQARGDELTILPEDLKPPAHWISTAGPTATEV